jgi:DNA-directed RNA polymerase specialized sigma subunit
MVLSREEKEKMVLDLYYTKDYTYKQLTRELRMSPNQLREIIKRHEEKKNDDAIANKKKSCLYLLKLTNCSMRVELMCK